MRAKVSVLLALVSALSMTTVNAATPAPAGGQPIVEAPRQVTHSDSPVHLFDIPALAVDPADPATVVLAVGDARNGGCGLRVSRDGGLSWATPAETLLPSSSTFCIQRAFGPVMAPAFASNGSLYVAMSGSSTDAGHPNGPIDMLLSRTDDLGTTHQTVTVAKAGPVTVDPATYGGSGSSQMGNAWNKFPSLAVDPTDPKRLYLAWRWTVWGTNLKPLAGDVPFRPYLATSTDGGQTWGNPVDLLTLGPETKAYGASAPELVVARDGTVYGFSKELTQSSYSGPAAGAPPDNNPRLLMFKSTDHGATWKTSVLNQCQRPQTWDHLRPVWPETRDQAVARN